MKFAMSAMHHKQDVIKYIFQNSMQYEISLFHSNVNYFLNDLNVLELGTYAESLIEHIDVICDRVCKPGTTKCDGLAIKELCATRDGLMTTVLNVNELYDIIEFICIS